MAKARTDKPRKPNIFMRIGLYIKQTFNELRKVVTPTGKELFLFVLVLMALVTAMDFGLGKLVLLVFG